MTTPWSVLGRAIVQSGSARWLLAACSLWLLLTAGIRPLTLPDEGRYVGVAWEMLTSGNWLVPTLDGMPFFHKPPLFYWISAAALAVFGPHAWAARMASMLPAIAAMITVHAFVRHYRHPGTAHLTVVMLATQPFFFGAAQFANLDMLVASMITLTTLCVSDAALRIDCGQPYLRSLAAGYVCAALGVLAKGLIGLVLPAAVVFIWLALRGKLRLVFRPLNLPLLALFLIMATPWFVLMAMLFPAFPDYFFLEHHVRGFAGTGFNNVQAVWFYLPVLLLLSFPWSLWCLRLIGDCRYLKNDDPNGISLLMRVWLLVIIIFFSLPRSKLIGYILPALVPFAFLLADSARRWRTRHPAADGWLGLCAGFGVAVCIGLLVFMTLRDPSQLSKLAGQREHGFRNNDQVVMLDHYPYDLPFYLGATTPAWVVGQWDDPSIAKTDNWKKELADAGRFDLQASRRQLISAQQLSARLCAEPYRRYWIWGQHNAPTTLGWLSAVDRVFANNRYTLWRLQPADANVSALCDGKPSSG